MAVQRVVSKRIILVLVRVNNLKGLKSLNNPKEKKKKKPSEMTGQSMAGLGRSDRLCSQLARKQRFKKQTNKKLLCHPQPLDVNGEI